METVEQYLTVLKRGTYTFNMFDETSESWFKPTAATLKFLSQAAPSRQSLLPKGLLLELPVSILGPDEYGDEKQRKQDIANGLTLDDFRRSGKLKKFEFHGVTLKCETRSKSFDGVGDFIRRGLGDLFKNGRIPSLERTDNRYRIIELARGDFDGDGFEDSLVSMVLYDGIGPGWSDYTLLVTRTNAQQKSIIVAPFTLP